MDDQKEYELVEKGPLEKSKLRNSIIKKQNENVTNFFNELRSSFQRPNRRDKIMKMLFHELDQTLTSEEKELLSRKWRPGAPIILVTGVNQLKEIRTHLNSLNLIDQENIVEIRTAETKEEDYFLQLLNENSPLEVDMFLDSTPQIINNFEIENDSWDQSLSFTRSSEMNETFSDFIEEPGHGYGRLNDESIKAPAMISEFSDSIYYKGTNANDSLVETRFNQLSEVIKTDGDVTTMLSLIKNSYGPSIYTEVLNYCNMDQEPVLFQLVSNMDRHECALKMLNSDGRLNLTQRNYLKISVFYFLLMKNIDSLYNFLKFTKNLNLKNEVQNVCLSDKSLKLAIHQKKQGDKSYSTAFRTKLEVIEKYCLNG